MNKKIIGYDKPIIILQNNKLNIAYVINKPTEIILEDLDAEIMKRTQNARELNATQLDTTTITLHDSKLALFTIAIEHNTRESQLSFDSIVQGKPNSKLFAFIRKAAIGAFGHFISSYARIRNNDNLIKDFEVFHEALQELISNALKQPIQEFIKTHSELLTEQEATNDPLETYNLLISRLPKDQQYITDPHFGFVLEIQQKGTKDYLCFDISNFADFSNDATFENFKKKIDALNVESAKQKDLASTMNEFGAGLGFSMIQLCLQKLGATIAPNYDQRRKIIHLVIYIPIN